MPRLDFQKIANEREPFEIVLTDGELVTLPKTVNAKAMLNVLDGRSPSQLNNLPAEERQQFGQKIIAAVIGEDLWDKILEGIGAENIPAFTEELYTYYNLGGRSSADEEDEGKAETGPEELSLLTTSSTISEPLTQTSNGFIPVAGNDSTEADSNGKSSSQESDISPPSPSL